MMCRMALVVLMDGHIAYLLGLLPDNDKVLERWARTYHASARNPFALLGHVGEDCAGAVQFITPDRVESQLAREGGVTWMSEAEVADRIRLLRRDPAAWHIATTGKLQPGRRPVEDSPGHGALGRAGSPHKMNACVALVRPSGLAPRALACSKTERVDGRRDDWCHGLSVRTRLLSPQRTLVLIRRQGSGSVPRSAVLTHGYPLEQIV
jgi:hypothetical protein